MDNFSSFNQFEGRSRESNQRTGSQRAGNQKEIGQGHVALVGAGPGDPELLTLRAYRVIQQAEVLIYDRLVDARIVALVSPECKKIYAGKRKHLHMLNQTQIHDRLVEEAKAGRFVVRLKGGDPFIFGRGGEEIDVLTKEEISWEVVPGISAGIGAAAASGIALTHRDYAQAVTFVTAHRRQGVLDIDWDLALHGGQTVVFYMAVSVSQELAQGLIDRGAAPSSQISVVSDATCESEHVETLTLADLAREALGISPRSVLILHEVPRLKSPVYRSQGVDVFERNVELI